MSQQKKQKSFFGVKVIVQLLALVGIVTFALFSARGTSEKIADVNEQRARVDAQIETELFRERQIQDTAAYMRSRPFIETTARNFLGLVHRDEIILIMKEGEGTD